MPEVSNSNMISTGSLSTKSTSICIGCGLFIKDQFIYKVLPDMQWHESCLKCAECDCKLKENSTCFVKNGKAYCKTDYNKLFLIKCNRCGDVIKRNDLIMKSRSKIYHFECFCCNVCNKKLQPGDEYQIRDDQLYCKDDAILNLNSTTATTSTPTSTTSTIIQQQQQHYQTSLNTTTNNSNSTQLYLSNLNGYTSSTMAITPENSVSSSCSYSPSTNSSSSSIVDSPNNLSNYTSNTSFNYNTSTNHHNNTNNNNNTTNNISINNQYNSNYQTYIDSNNNNRSEYDFHDKEDDRSISDDDDDLDNDDDDNDNSISEESSLNESVNSNGMLNKNKNKKNGLKTSSSKSMFGNGYPSNSLLKVHGGSSGGSSGHKQPRIRTVLNEKQLHTLRACYGANPRPDALMKEQLVEMTGLNPRVIRVWFQNKRCKDKKKNMLVRPDQINQQHQQLQLSNPQFNTHHPIPNIPNQHNIMFDNCY